MKNILSKITIILLQIFFVNTAFSEVYLFTDHSGEGHSILVHVAKDGTVSAVNPYPGKDPRVTIKDGVLFNGVVKIHDFNTGVSFKDYSMLDLGVAAGSDLESKILQEINYYQAKEISGSWSDTWLIKNCGQSTFETLHVAGYFDPVVVRFREQKYGEVEIWNSPEATEYAVRFQIQINAGKARNTYEKSSTPNEGDLQDQNEDNASNSGREPDGDNVVSNDNNGGDNSNETPSGDSVVDGGEQQTGDGDSCVNNGEDDGAESNNSGTEPDGDEVVSGGDDSKIDVGSDSEDSPVNMGAVVGAIMDHTSIVGPNIPHYRVLWIFAGEPWDDTVKEIVEGGKSLLEGIVHGDISFSSLKDFFQNELGGSDMVAAFDSLGK